MFSVTLCISLKKIIFSYRANVATIRHDEFFHLNHTIYTKNGRAELAAVSCPGAASALYSQRMDSKYEESKKELMECLSIKCNLYFRFHHE